MRGAAFNECTEDCLGSVEAERIGGKLDDFPAGNAVFISLFKSNPSSRSFRSSYAECMLLLAATLRTKLNRFGLDDLFVSAMVLP